jgi:polar amino acid transport system substrate-binding protein
MNKLLPQTAHRSLIRCVICILLGAGLIACHPPPALAQGTPASAAPLSVPSSASSASSASSGLLENGVLSWGADLQGGKPYVYADPDHAGQIKGFEVDLARALAKELGAEARHVQNDWSALVPSLERGTFDIILNGLEVTPARLGRVAFTRPYYVFAERLMARRDDPRLVGNDLGVLFGKPPYQSLRVGTLGASLSEHLLSKAGLPSANLIRYEGQEEPYVDLSAGRTDAVLLDDVIASRYGEIRPDLRVVGDVAEGVYSVGVLPTNPRLVARLDQALGHVIASGELSAILRREGLDNPRQARLATWTEADQRALVSPDAGEQAVTATGPRQSTMTSSQLTSFFRAASTTLFLSVFAMLLAVPLGLLLAMARLFGPTPVARLAGLYVELYRGTPVLLQLYVLYYGLADTIRLSAPVAAIVGLGMNYAAYEAEVYRAGILAVPKGQMEASLALGMSTPLALRRVIVPQAMRIALPAVTNDFIALLKDSSLVSIITVVELTKQMTIVAVDTRSYVLPGLLCAGLYFAMSYPLSLFAKKLDERLGRG